MIIFSILIPIHNRINLTKQGLSSLYTALNEYKINGNCNCQFEVIVIDDGSKDGSSEWISSNYPAIHLLKGDGKLWWSGAINKAASYAIKKLDSDYLLLWNDDIVPEKEFFVHVEQVFTTYPFKDSIIGSKIMYKDSEDKTWSIGGYFNKMTGTHGLYNNPEVVRNGFFECDWQPGMGTFIPTSIIKKFSLSWDEKRFPQYHGDSDFTLRCKAKGIKISTCLKFIIFNSAEINGFKKINSFSKLYISLTSLRSNSNLSKSLLFYTRHGIFPFAYFGFIKDYILLIGGFLKRKILAFTEVR